MADLARYIASSNIPGYAKGAFTRWLAASGDLMPAAAVPGAMSHAVAGIHVVRQYGEAGITGAVLAALAVHLPTGLDLGGKAPIDLGVSLAGAVLAVAMPREDGATSARNIGAAAASIYAFRQTGKFLATKTKAAGKKVGGTFAGDDDSPEWSHPSLSGDGTASVADRLTALAASL